MCAVEVGEVIVAVIAVAIAADIVAAIVGIAVDMEADAMPADITVGTMDHVPGIAVAAIAIITAVTGMDGHGGSVLPRTHIMIATITTTITCPQGE